MKKILGLLIAGAMIAVVATGCGKKEDAGTGEPEKKTETTGTTAGEPKTGDTGGSPKGDDKGTEAPKGDDKGSTTETK